MSLSTSMLVKHINNNETFADKIFSNGSGLYPLNRYNNFTLKRFWVLASKNEIKEINQSSYFTILNCFEVDFKEMTKADIKKLILIIKNLKTDTVFERDQVELFITSATEFIEKNF